MRTELSCCTHPFEPIPIRPGLLYVGNILPLLSNRKNLFVVSFGMQMPGRHGSLSGANYRYKFNGMEADGDVSGEGNSYTTQFRQYDPRLGRWKSLDPLAWKFISHSPYNNSFNNPLIFVDYFGDDPIYKVKTRYENGRLYVSVEVELNVKVINGSTENVNKEKLIKDLNYYGSSFKGKGKDGKIIGNQYFHYYDKMIKLDEQGNVSYDGQPTKIDEVIVTVEKLSITFKSIDSYDDVEEGDNVIVLTDNLHDWQSGGFTMNDVSIVAIPENDNIVHTVLHEATHQAGAQAESYEWDSECQCYKDGSTGEIMDMTGYLVGSTTAADIGIEAIETKQDKNPDDINADNDAFDLKQENYYTFETKSGISTDQINKNSIGNGWSDDGNRKKQRSEAEQKKKNNDVSKGKQKQKEHRPRF